MKFDSMIGASQFFNRYKKLANRQDTRRIIHETAKSLGQDCYSFYRTVIVSGFGVFTFQRLWPFVDLGVMSMAVFCGVHEDHFLVRACDGVGMWDRSMILAIIVITCSASMELFMDVVCGIYWVPRLTRMFQDSAVVKFSTYIESAMQTHQIGVPPPRSQTTSAFRIARTYAIIAYTFVGSWLYFFIKPYLLFRFPFSMPKNHFLVPYDRARSLVGGLNSVAQLCLAIVFMLMSNGDKNEPPFTSFVMLYIFMNVLNVWVNYFVFQDLIATLDSKPKAVIRVIVSLGVGRNIAPLLLCLRFRPECDFAGEGPLNDVKRNQIWLSLRNNDVLKKLHFGSQNALPMRAAEDLAKALKANHVLKVVNGLNVHVQSKRFLFKVMS
jgi:hypothetical protein